MQELAVGYADVGNDKLSVFSSLAVKVTPPNEVLPE